MKKDVIDYSVGLSLVLLVAGLITILILSVTVPSNSELVDKAMKDGRWEKFEQCIDPSPTDMRCDSCWNVYILQKPQKNNKYR